MSGDTKEPMMFGLVPRPPYREARRASAAAAVALTLLATATACGGDDGGGSGGDDEGGLGGPRVLGTITDSLATMPTSFGDEEGVTIAWGDVERAAEIAGVEPPSDPTDGGAVDDYLAGITGSVRGTGAADDAASLALPEVAWVPTSDELEAFADDVGWSVLEVDRFVEIQSTTEPVAVLEGDFDEGAITDALGEPTDGTWVAGSGEAWELDPEDRSPARPLGEPLWLSGGGTHLAVARSPTAIDATTAALDRGRDGGRDRAGDETLGGDPVLAQLAGALDAQSAYAATLVMPGLNTVDLAGVILDPSDPSGGLPDPSDVPEQLTELCSNMLRQPTLGVATGVADDDGPVILIALAHASATAAADNAAAIEEVVSNGDNPHREQPWNELAELDDVETTGDGLVTIARLRPKDAIDTRLWHELPRERNSLLTSC